MTMNKNNQAVHRVPLSAGLCPYCGREPKLVSGLVIYPHRPDLRDKHFYQCAPCDAYVGCHPGTLNALGRLANGELRKAKIAAHAVFDPLWKGGTKKRGSAYAWLSDATGIAKKDCHIGMMDVADCLKVVKACKGHNAEIKGQAGILACPA